MAKTRVKTHTYRTFILRSWAEPLGTDHVDAVQHTWRFRVDDVQSGASHGFTDLEAVLIFLKAELEQAEPPDEHPSPPSA